MVELEENVMINASFANACSSWYDLRFGSESGYFKGEDVVAFTLPKIKKELTLMIMNYRISRRMHYRDEYLGYFSKNRSNPTRFWLFNSW
jgi:hypothetical protein